MSFSCSRGVRCKAPPGFSINLTRDNGVAAVQHLLRYTPESDQSRGDLATIQTQCTNYDSVRRKCAEAPYYHRRREALSDFAQRCFEVAPCVYISSGAANVER